MLSFVASFSANTDFKEGLALHYSKVKKGKVLFYAFFVLFLETTKDDDDKEEYTVSDKVKSRQRAPSASDTVEVYSSLLGQTSGDSSSSSQHRKHDNVA